MRLAFHIKKSGLREDPQWTGLKAQLRSDGHSLVEVSAGGSVPEGTELLLSVGGDGTFLSAARISVENSVPVLGVNLGRLGFLSENKPSDVAAALRSGAWSVEERGLLEIGCSAPVPENFWKYALNEVSLNRICPAMMGVDVAFEGQKLPTYWADGLLIATSSGSTAYSLSAGGPILTPEVRAFVIAPIAPHNLNLRPLVVPESSRIELRLHSRDGKAMLSLDNRNFLVPSGTAVEVKLAPVRLRRVRLGTSDFVGALRSRLFWGEDVRNSSIEE